MLALTDSALAHLAIAATGVDPRQRREWLREIAAKLDPPRAIIARWQRYAGPDNGGARARQSSDSKADDDGSELVLIRPGLSVRWAPHTRGCSSSR